MLILEKRETENELKSTEGSELELTLVVSDAYEFSEPSSPALLPKYQHSQQFDGNKNLALEKSPIGYDLSTSNNPIISLALNNEQAF